MATVNITIDRKAIKAEQGMTVLKAAQQADIHIPTLCYHPSLPPEAACRVCLVEVKGSPTLQTACTFPVVEGLEVFTDTPEVMIARRTVLELLLADHPLDCMTCESAGACELQDLAYEFDIQQTPYLPSSAEEHPVDPDPNPFIYWDMNKCILCRRCVRACHYIEGADILTASQRGFATTISTAFGEPLEESACEFCGQCVQFCPVNAISERMPRRKARIWETKKVRTTCAYCGCGCNLELHVKDNEVVNVKANFDAKANEGSLCVKGRFGYDYINHPDRLTTPLIRKNGELVESTWDEALDLVANTFGQIKEEHGADALAVLTSARCTNEENYLLQKFARAVLGTNNADHCARL
jgi:predicted molibdopterin-dependent oxidoreductase YjgC